MQNIGNNSINNYKIIKQLQKDIFTQILLVKSIINNHVYILKKIKLSKVNNQDKSNLIAFISTLSTLHHRYFVHILQHFFDHCSHSICLVMEFCSSGNLSKIINQHISNQIRISQQVIWKVILNILQALHHLHKKKILHKNLKPSNIILTSDGTYKLSDIKLLQRQLVNFQKLSSFTVSPQIWQDLSYTQKSDIWSLGCIIYQMTNLHPPFQSNDIYQLYQKIKSGKYQPISTHYSHQLSQIIQLMLKVSLRDRPNAPQLLNHPIIKKKSLTQPQQKNLPSSQSQQDLSSHMIKKLTKSSKLVVPIQRNSQNNNKIKMYGSVQIKKNLLDIDHSSQKNRPLSNSQLRIPKIRIINPQNNQQQNPIIKQLNKNNNIKFPQINSHQTKKINLPPKPPKKMNQKTNQKNQNIQLQLIKPRNYIYTS